jgi:hypothetical protein
LIGLDDNGAIVLREKIARGRIAARLANVPRCLIGIEAGMAESEVRKSITGDGGTTEFVVHAQGDHIDVLGDPDERTSNYRVHCRERTV